MPFDPTPIQPPFLPALPCDTEVATLRWSTVLLRNSNPPTIPIPHSFPGFACVCRTAWRSAYQHHCVDYSRTHLGIHAGNSLPGRWRRAELVQDANVSGVRTCSVLLSSSTKEMGRGSPCADTLLIIGSCWSTMRVLFFEPLHSYVKMWVSLIKYAPQAWSNFKRKSTVGWSIGWCCCCLLIALFSAPSKCPLSSARCKKPNNPTCTCMCAPPPPGNILLDCTGGTLSILQLILDSIREGK